MQLEVIKQGSKSRTHSTPLLCVHGKWHEASVWVDHFMPFFAEQGYLVHALSLRGHGGSDGRARLWRTTLSDYVDDVAQVVSEMETPPVLIAHSMAGLVLQKYLERHDAPGAVLMASTPPSGALLAALRILLRHPLATAKSTLTLSLKPIVGNPRLVRDILFSAETPEETVETCFNRLQNDSLRAFLDEILLDLPKTNLINTPILVLGADADTLFSVQEIERTANAYGTQAHMFPGGHNMMLEPGWRDVASRILAWLEKLCL